jgi:glycogen debranching enzyme
VQEDGIWIDDQYYILATAAREPGVNAVLKHDDTFAIFDPSGDIVASGGSEHGLYYDGTRHLSTLTVRLGTTRPLLLSSRTSATNELFGADLTNTDVVEQGAVVLPRDLVHLFRCRFLTQGFAYDRLRIVNYSAARVPLSIIFGYGADFADIFEVRGTRRIRRGVLLPTDVGENFVELAYQGLDDVVRRTRLTWNPPPTAIGESLARCDVRIGPKETVMLSLTVQCGTAPLGTPPLLDGSCDFDAARAAAEERDREKQREYTVVTTSNAQFNEWITRSLADLRLMTTDTGDGQYPYAGVPWFSTAFGRDGIITALEVLWLNPNLARGVLQYLAATQADKVSDEQDAEPGKILHETRGGEMAALGEVPFRRYYGSVDSTPLFVLLAGEYYRRSADLPFIATIWPNIDKAVRWMTEYGDVDGDGFLEYQRHTPNGLVQQGWKDSQDSVFHADGMAAEPPIALCEVQAYAFAALQAASALAAALGEKERATELAVRAASLRLQFEKAFWSEELSTYALALDGRKRPCLVRSSNPGHCLFAGIADPTRAKRVADSLMGADLFSGWGIRTIGMREARYNPMSYHNGSLWPHDNAIAAAGLARYGLTDAVMHIVAGLFEASLYVDLQRLPELFCGFRRRTGEGPTLYPVACAPQAWAAGAVFLLLQSCLGLSIDAVNGHVAVTHGRLPEFLNYVTVRGLTVGPGASIDLQFDRHAHDVGVTVLSRTGQIAVTVTK